MAAPVLVTGAAGRVGGIGGTVTELPLKQGKAELSLFTSASREPF